jgi:hypothetical protein
VRIEKLETDWMLAEGAPRGNAENRKKARIYLKIRTEWLMQISSGSDRRASRGDLASDDFLCGVFTAPAAAGDREVALNFRQGTGAAVHDFADLAITDAIAKTNVHALGSAELGWDGI